MEKLIIVGASGHGAEIQDYIEFHNKISEEKYEIIGYLNKFQEDYDNYQFHAPLLESSSDHKVRSDYKYILAIANVKIRKRVANTLIEKGANIISFIHPTAMISPSAKIGKGVVIAPNVNVGPNAILGDFNVLNARVSVGHDTIIGKFNIISPNVCFSGSSKIGDENNFGINSATIPSISVGNRNVIAAGMTLNKNVKDDETVFYRYKEKVVIVSK